MTRTPFFSRLLCWFERPWLRMSLSLLLTATVIVFVVYALHHSLSEVSFKQVQGYIRNVAPMALFLAIAASAASYLVLTGYDFLALEYLGLQKRLPRSAIGITSFMAYTMTNTVGMGVLAGGAVRMRMFTQWGLTPMQVTRLIAFNAMAFWIGLGTLVAAVLLFETPDFSAVAHIPDQLLHVLALAGLAAVAVLLWFCTYRRTLSWGRWSLELPRLSLALRQLSVTALDTVFASLTLWFLLPNSELQWWTYFALFVIALVAGIVSHVPGGLGVFEVLILTGLSSSVPPSSLAASLVLFRLVYYLLPLLAAATLTGCYLLAVRVRGRRGAQPGAAPPAATASLARGLIWVAPLLLGSLTFAAGAVLLISGAIPASQGAAGLQALHVPSPFIETSHLIGSICGLLLLVLARGIVYRLDAAWWLALLVSAVAFWLSMSRGIQWYEMMVLMPLFGLLLLSRSAFTRRSSLVAMRFELGWILAIASTLAGIGWILYFALEHQSWGQEQWWQFALDSYAPRTLRTGMLVAVAAVLWGSWQLLRRPTPTDHIGPGKPVADNAGRWERLKHSMQAPGLDTIDGGYLLRLNPEGASLRFRSLGRTWVALGPPEGPLSQWPDITRAFIDMARSNRMRPAFLLDRSRPQELYLDAGLSLYQLGHAQVIMLADCAPVPEPQDGPQWRWLTAEQVPPMQAQLHDISVQWRRQLPAPGGRLAPAALEPARIASGPVAVLYVQDQPRAFVSMAVLEKSPHGACAKIDLVRCADALPATTIAQTFNGLLALLRQHGLKALDLGLSPLQENETTPPAANWLKAARLILPHSELFYHIGMAELQTRWQPLHEQRYLAATGSLSSLLILADIAPVSPRQVLNR